MGGETRTRSEDLLPNLPIWAALGYDLPESSYEQFDRSPGVYDVDRVINLASRIQQARDGINRNYLGCAMDADARVRTSMQRRGLLGRRMYIQARVEATDSSFKNALREFIRWDHAGRPDFVVRGNKEGLGLTKYILENEGIKLERRASGLGVFQHLLSTNQ